MVKFKAKIKNEQLLVKAKLGSTDEVNEKEINSLTNRPIRGLLKPEVSKKNLITYTGPIGISLYDRLKKPVTQYEFFLIMSQITDLVRKMRSSNLSMDNLHLDLRYTFINESTKELHFIYLPLISQHICVDMRGFMETITYMATPQAEQNPEFVSKFMFFLRSLEGFDISKIEAYIAGEDIGVAERIKRNASEGKDFKAPGAQSEEIVCDATTVLIPDEETGLLMEETMILADNAVEPVIKYPSMKRVSTEEVISVDKPVYRLGKENSYVDYFVANNNKVSRSHANIITKEGKYFIQDLNSTNGTFINGKMISPEVEVEIYDKDQIRLANEEFIFCID